MHRYSWKGVEFDRCPNWYMAQAPWVHELLEIWRWRDKGFLPLESGQTFLDMPNRVIEMLDYVDFLTSEKNKWHKTRN